MGKRKLKLPSPATAIALVALFVALGGTGYAVVSGSGIPDRSGVFHGCVDRRTGALRVVASAGACRRAHGNGRHRTLGEFAISWSQKGPSGTPGRNGTNGVNGNNGSNGADGSAIAYASLDAQGHVDPANSKNIPQGSVTNIHNGIYCFTSVNFVPHVINVTPQRTAGVVGGTVEPPPISALEWNANCGSSSKSENSFIVEMLSAASTAMNGDFTVTVN